jgi:glycosyltransferase involved in cell wall biosynthesis
MNNIEVQVIKRDARKFFGEEYAEKIDKMNSNQIDSLKQKIHNLKQKEYKSHIEKRNEEIKKRKDSLSDPVQEKTEPMPMHKMKIKNAEEIQKIKKAEIKKVPLLKKAEDLEVTEQEKTEPMPMHKIKLKTEEVKNVPLLKKAEDLEVTEQKISITSKPRILFVADVKDWAWWIKSEYLKKYLSDEFEIDIINALGNREKRIDPMDYDIFFTFGFSFVSFFNYVPKKKKVTGVTAHRRKGVILPAMSKAGWIHANSKLLQKDLERWGLKRVFYLPNGVDEELFKPETRIPMEAGQITVGHVGKKSANKGQEDFILPAIKQSKAKSFYHFNDYTNSIPHKEMPKVYQNFDIYICASYEDGTPNPALESAACGRPILTNKIGNMPEFVVDGYNGFLVERNIKQYVDKIRWFRTYPEKLIEMGENARKTVLEGWTWKVQSENYRNMFREILRNK